jgi:hypothetical protein
MRKELEEQLYRRYPALFADRALPLTESAMGRGFCCGDGWFWLIDTLCASIQWRVDHCGMPPVSVVQVKEKCGSLRFYYRGGDDVTQGMVTMAVAASERICESSGHLLDTGSGPQNA